MKVGKLSIRNKTFLDTEAQHIKQKKKQTIFIRSQWVMDVFKA